ncbi:ATP-binding protein [Kitasatospora sp. NPDC004745]|uniref:ATP-binding protein n=1 Tax=Kitasatospora sp. NPDC004745 TaxID=3364019 RepID=UPI003688C931
MNPSREALGAQPVPVRAGLAPLPAGGQRRRLPLVGLPRPVSRARAFTVDALADWSWPDPGRAGDVVLLVAELVANAALHAGGALELVLHTSATRLRVEVSDRSRVVPVPREPHRPASPGGHGLIVVRRAADRWGTALHHHGKTVWAEVDV